MSLNSFMGMGRITREPELKTTQSGVEYTVFTVAIDKYLGKDKEKKTDWIPCKAWKQTAVFINKYFHKGDGIIVEGPLSTEQYEDRKTGEKKTAYNIEVHEAYFPIGGKKSGAGDDNPFTANESPAEELTNDEGELPF